MSLRNTSRGARDVGPRSTPRVTSSSRLGKVLLPCALAVVGALGCEGAGSGAASGSRLLTIYAASSLTDTFEALASDYEQANPETDIELNFAGSHVLRLQIEQGAPADVFVSADAEHMNALVESNRIERSVLFAHNELALIVPRDNPARLERFGDLPRASRIVLADTNAPIGRYTRDILNRAGPEFEAAVLDHLVSRENNVRLVRAKVELGEADAAVVYRTDAIHSELIQIISIPEAMNVSADYFAGSVRKPNAQPAAADRWLDYLQSARAASILREHGFIVGTGDES